MFALHLTRPGSEFLSPIYFIKMSAKNRLRVDLMFAQSVGSIVNRVFGRILFRQLPRRKPRPLSGLALGASLGEEKIHVMKRFCLEVFWQALDFLVD